MLLIALRYFAFCRTSNVYLLSTNQTKSCCSLLCLRHIVFRHLQQKLCLLQQYCTDDSWTACLRCLFSSPLSWNNFELLIISDFFLKKKNPFQTQTVAHVSSYICPCKNYMENSVLRRLPKVKMTYFLCSPSRNLADKQTNLFGMICLSYPKSSYHAEVT